MCYPIMNLESIPLLAKGGIVTKPTLAVIGWRDDPEVLIPLTNENNLNIPTEATKIDYTKLAFPWFQRGGLD